ncbi:MAG: hypothetical protein LBT89_06605 [Planctomycetaceae bacterium]|nr:hypothetical protein [Planctomycetaceae bacterium]
MSPFEQRSERFLKRLLHRDTAERNAEYIKKHPAAAVAPHAGKNFVQASFSDDEYEMLRRNIGEQNLSEMMRSLVLAAAKRD